MEKLNKINQVKQYILKKIDSNVYREGQIINSEHELCDILGVSRVTVRSALQELVLNGVLYKEKGRGTFVSARSRYSEFRYGVGFTRELKMRGLNPSTIDATLELVEADKSISTHLKIDIGAKAWKVTRVRCGDSIPILYAEEYYNYYQCEDMTLNVVYNSIYSFLEEKDIFLTYVDQKIEAVLSDEFTSTKLGININTPLIKMEIVAYMKNGLPFNFGTEYYRTDKYKLVQSSRSNTL